MEKDTTENNKGPAALNEDLVNLQWKVLTSRVEKFVQSTGLELSLIRLDRVEAMEQSERYPPVTLIGTKILNKVLRRNLKRILKDFKDLSVKDSKNLAKCTPTSTGIAPQHGEGEKLVTTFHPAAGTNNLPLMIGNVRSLSGAMGEKGDGVARGEMESDLVDVKIEDVEEDGERDIAGNGEGATVLDEHERLMIASENTHHDHSYLTPKLSKRLSQECRVLVCPHRSCAKICDTAKAFGDHLKIYHTTDTAVNQLNQSCLLEPAVKKQRTDAMRSVHESAGSFCTEKKPQPVSLFANMAIATPPMPMLAPRILQIVGGSGNGTEQRQMVTLKVVNFPANVGSQAKIPAKRKSEGNSVGADGLLSSDGGSGGECEKDMDDTSDEDEDDMKLASKDEKAKKLTCRYNQCNMGFDDEESRNKHEGFHRRETFTCSECGKWFYLKAYYNAHMVYHQEDSSCRVCGKSFANRHRLHNHALSHEQILRFTCHVCCARFAERSQLWEHERSHTNVQLFICDRCGRQFRKKHSFKLHMRLHNPKQQYCCNECGISVTTKYYLKLHKRMHEPQEQWKYVCKVCQMRFPWRNTLMKHEYTCQQGFPKKPRRQTQYRCPFCQASFTTRQERKQHKCVDSEKWVNVEAEKNDLSVDKVFASAEVGITGMVERMGPAADKSANINSKESSATEGGKPGLGVGESSPSEKVGLTATVEMMDLAADKLKSESIYNKKNLVTVMGKPAVGEGKGSTAGGDSGSIVIPQGRLLRCHLCPNVYFVSISVFNEHNKTAHTATRDGPFPAYCSLCGRMLQSAAQLSRHMAEHTGIRPYKCLPCDQWFVTRGGLSRHAMRKHGGPPSSETCPAVTSPEVVLGSQPAPATSSQTTADQITTDSGTVDHLTSAHEAIVDQETVCHVTSDHVTADLEDGNYVTSDCVTSSIINLVSSLCASPGNQESVDYNTIT